MLPRCTLRDALHAAGSCVELVAHAPAAAAQSVRHVHPSEKLIFTLFAGTHWQALFAWHRNLVLCLRTSPSSARGHISKRFHQLLSRVPRPPVAAGWFVFACR